MEIFEPAKKKINFRFFPLSLNMIINQKKNTRQTNKQKTLFQKKNCILDQEHRTRLNLHLKFHV